MHVKSLCTPVYFFHHNVFFVQVTFCLQAMYMHVYRTQPVVRPHHRCTPWPFCHLKIETLGLSVEQNLQKQGMRKPWMQLILQLSTSCLMIMMSARIQRRCIVLFSMAMARTGMFREISKRTNYVKEQQIIFLYSEYSTMLA